MKNERCLAIGMAYVGVGNYPGAGVPGVELNQITDIFEGSVVFNFAEPAQTKIMIEGTDEPRWIVNRKGDVSSVEFAIPSPTVDDMVMFCGGTKEGNRWEEPNVIPTINKTVKMNTEPYDGTYTEYVIVNGSISARISQGPTKTASELLLVKVTKQIAATADGTLKSPFTREVKAVNATEVTAVTISGAPKVGTALAAVPTPALATGVYQWQKKIGTEPAVEIVGAVNQVYVPVAGDVGAKISVQFIASGSYSGTVTSAESVAVVA